MSDEMEEVRGWNVRGRVQGVGFRWWTRKLASRVGVRGRVRNLPDGTVEVHAVGSKSALDRLAGALETGPPISRVETVMEEPVSDEIRREAAAWSGFEIDSG